jgi:polyisoprenoid-binding protein YceI
MKQFLLAASLLAHSASLLALAAPSFAADWKVLPAESALTFTGSQTGEKFTGKFSRFEAKIALDPQKLDEAKIEVSVDLASAATGDKQRDTALPDTDWFAVKKFPQAVFVSKSVRKAGEVYEAIGDLTLRGVTKEVKLPFTLEIDGKKAHAKGHADLMRDAFGVGQGDWASDQWVAFQVGVDFDLKAEAN